MRYCMRLSYCGAPFHGWQTQPGEVTVQQVIEEALSKVMRTPMKIVGAGRTDTGVNARMMVAHFDTEAPIEDTAKLVGSLNALVGRDIAIEQIYEVEADRHARFDATSRTYHYYAVTSKTPFFYRLSWKAPATLDFEKMNEAASLLMTTTDFTSFAKLHSDSKTNICHVTRARWERVWEDGWVFVITADRFLRNMVKAVRGTLVEVERSKMTVEEFAEVIERRDRCAAGTSMPGHATYLWEVTY